MRLAYHGQPLAGEQRQRKVAAFVMGPRGLLVHAFAGAPALPLRVPGGGVEPHETPRAALSRELREEAGITRVAWLRPLGVRRFWKGYLNCWLARYDFAVGVAEPLPARWVQRVAGHGADAGERFVWQWICPAARWRVDAELRGVLTPETLPQWWALFPSP